jgi:hypothetical protein
MDNRTVSYECREACRHSLPPCPSKLHSLAGTLKMQEVDVGFAVEAEGANASTLVFEA